jgi:serine/threonine-protein kinase
LLTGKRPFEGKTAVEICIQHVTMPPAPPSTVASIAPDLDDIIMKCLAKKPTDRWASAAALADVLNAIVPCGRPGHTTGSVAGDWDHVAAKRWWSEFQMPEDAAAAKSEESTMTITVDLAQRATTHDVRSP